MFGLDSILDIGRTVLDKFIPDANEREKAKAALAKAALDGELEPMRIQISAILAEAGSSDPWTSRARPSFMYVIYLMLLFGIPMGFLNAFRPELAQSVAAGFKAWLAAIPSELYTLFGVGYLGYTGARTVDKIKTPKL